LTAPFIQAVVLIRWGIADAVQSMLSGLPLTSYSSFFWNQFRKNDFAVYLMFISLLSLVILLRGDNRREKFLAVFLLILIPAAWFITRSRSGVLALTMGILIFLVLVRNGKLLKLLFSFSIIAVISFAIFPSEERDLALDGLRAIVNPENVVAERNLETISLRFELMEAGWQVFADQPLLGVGFNQWQFYSPISNYRRDPRTSELILKPLEIHNQHLQIATNNGLFALMGYLGFVTIILISGMRARPKARGMIRSLLHALIAILLVEQITLMVMTGFLWEWPIFGIFIGLINVAKIEKRQSGESL
jgi:O-antigen ligase